MVTVEIETMPGANTAAPLLLLQGTGGTNQEMLTFGRRLAPQSPLITIAGQYGQGAARQYYRQTAAGPTDATEVHNAAAWLATTVETLCRDRNWDGSRLVTVGYSNGAAIGLYGTRTGLLPGNCGIFFRPLALPVTTPVKLAGHRLWLSAGKRDALVSLATVNELKLACENAGAQVTMTQYNGSHQLTPREVQAAYEWLNDGQ